MAYFAVQRRFPPPLHGRDFQFLLPRESSTRGWIDALSVLWAPAAAREIGGLSRIDPIGAGAESPRRAILVSYLLHIAALYLLLQVPHFTGASAGQVTRQSMRTYEVRVLDLSKYTPILKAPVLKAKGSEGKSRSQLPDSSSPPADTASQPHMRFVSNPPRPNNRRQTIIQTAAPPSVVLPFEVAVPNIFVEKAQPKLLLPLAPATPSGARKTVAEVPAPDAHSDLALKLPDSVNPSPRLPAPPVPLASSSKAGDSAASASAAPGGSPQEGILTISIDPAPASTVVGLPLGNRYGAFSIGSAAGSTVGTGTGAHAGGSGGSDGSGGIGRGTSKTGQGEGEGGNSDVAVAGIAMSGKGLPGSKGSAVIRPSEIFAVPTNPSHIRKNSLVVSTGPAGGGGLPVYGVLQGGRIYTVYFSMPGTLWVMQYCHRSPTATPKRESSAMVVQMEQGVLAPEPIERFDFHRPPVAAGKKGSLIILRGKLVEDGSIEQLEVLQGVAADVDGRALAAAQKWRFRPALRDGKAVAVEFLLGIPANVPGA